MSDETPTYKTSVQHIFSKEDLLNFTKQLEVRTVDLSPIGLDGAVLIQELIAADRDYWEASALVDAQQGNTLALETGSEGINSKIAGETLRSRMVALSLAEKLPDGKVVKMYNRGDEHVIKQWPAKLVNFIANAAFDLNGISEEDQEKIKNDLAQAASEDSNLDSPEN